MARDRGLRVRWARIHGHTPKGVLDEALVLPVVLGDFTVTEEASHADYSTVSAGEFSVGSPGPATARSLRDLDLSTLSLAWDAEWLMETEMDDASLRRALYKVLRSKRPVEMLASIEGLRHPEELRTNVTLRSIQRILRPGEADTRYYDLTLREWRDPSGERRAAGASASQGRGGHRLPATARLTAKTTLMSLADEFYGIRSPWYAQIIANTNGLRSWGFTTPIVETKRYKIGDAFKIPLKPKRV